MPSKKNNYGSWDPGPPLLKRGQDDKLEKSERTNLEMASYTTRCRASLAIVIDKSLLANAKLFSFTGLLTKEMVEIKRHLCRCQLTKGDSEASGRWDNVFSVFCLIEFAFVVNRQIMIINKKLRDSMVDSVIIWD